MSDTLFAVGLLFLIFLLFLLFAGSQWHIVTLLYRPPPSCEDHTDELTTDRENVSP